MTCRKSRYSGHRFPPQIISYAVWAYHRFSMSFRDVEDLLAERGVIVSYETVRRWCLKFGARYRKALKRREGRPGDTWFVDEVFIKIGGKQLYLWRAVDQDGDCLEILVQCRRDARAAERFFCKVLKGQKKEPRRLVTDKLRSYGPAARSVLASAAHDTKRYANNAPRAGCALGAKDLINLLVGRSVRCGDSKAVIRPNVFLLCTHASKTCLATVAIY